MLPENLFSFYFIFFAADFVWSDEWVVNNETNNEYKFFENASLTSQGAKEACAKLGALLLSINNADEQTFVANRVLRKRTLAAFIGGSDAGNGEKEKLTIRSMKSLESFRNILVLPYLLFMSHVFA